MWLGRVIICYQTLIIYSSHYYPTVNIYRNKTIEANGNTGVIATTSKSTSINWEFL